MDRNDRDGGARLKRMRLAIAALVLIAIVAISYRQWRQYNRANDAGVASRQVIESVDALQSSLSDAETGQRGFLLTGEERYLEPYNQAVQLIPNELATLRGRLADRPNESANLIRLENLVGQKLSELRQTIDLCLSQGTAPVLSDRGKQIMDEIRALSRQINTAERTAQTEASLAAVAVSQTALLVTITGALVILIFFSIGFEPFMIRQSARIERSWGLRYAAAVLAPAAAVLLRFAMGPLVNGSHNVVPYITFFPAVFFVAWYGGFRATAFTILLSTLAAGYFFVDSEGVRAANPGDLVTLFIFVVISFGIALTTESQRRAVHRADQTESAERQQRQRFETTLASIGDAVIATDSDGRVTFANKIALSLMKWPELEVVGTHVDNVFRIVNEFTRKTVESPVARVLREGNIVGLANHTTLLARDGTETPIDDSAAPIRDADGSIQGTVLVFRDISERRKADATSRLLASIVESSDDAIISKNLNGSVTSWNIGAERIFGYSAAEMIGRPISVLADPDRADEMSGILERIRRGERVHQFRSLRRTKSGELIQASITVSPVRDGEGQITGASKIVRDITREVQAEKEIAEQRERLRVTLGSIGDAVMATDSSGRVSYLNLVAEQMTGWTSQEASTLPLEEVFRIVNEESRRTVENPVTKVLREGRVVGLANHTLLLSRDGRETPIDDSAAPIKDARGEVMGVVLIFRDITERRNTERLLAEQSAELRQRAHLTEPVHCFVRDLDDRIAYWNPGATDLYGYSADEALGQTSHSLLKTVFPMPLDQIRLQVMTAGRWTGQLVHTRRDGVVVTVASRWTLHRDGYGQPAAILEVNADITELRRTEEALRAAIEQLQLITDNMPAGVTRCSRDLKYVWVSRGYAASLGRAPEEILGRPIIEVVGKEAYETIRPHIERVLSGEREEYEAKVTYLGAGTRWLHAVYVPTQERNREGAGWIAVVTDVTERREAEEALRTSEERLATILKFLPIGIGVIDKHGHLVIGNPAWRKFLRGDIPGIDDDESTRWRATTGEGQPLPRAEYPAMRALRGEDVVPGIDFLFKDGDGDERWTRVSAVPLRDASSHITGALTLIQDIDEERRAEGQRAELLAKDRALAAEKTLREVEVELARVVRALSVGELATSIAHEINQPLAGVVTNAEAGLRWLSGETPNITEARESLALITRDGNRASAVIRRIREFLRKAPPQHTSLDLNQVVQAALDIARADFEKRGIVLHLDLHGNLPHVQGDRIQLQQVILNLAMNGADAMLSIDGRKELLIVSKISADGLVAVAVSDTGAGMNPNDMARMFDAFFTTKADGMGMGLSLSRSIIEAHHGRIWAEVNNGPGVTVQFALPADGVGQ